MNMCDDYKNQQDYNCIPYEQTIEVDRLSFAYVPFQTICSYYEPKEALLNGTIFPSLFMPYKSIK